MESEKSEVVAKADEGYSLKTKALIACKHEHEVGISIIIFRCRD